MNWYTCVLHIPRHISPIQWFHTRADEPKAAVRNAVRWFLEGEGDRWSEADIEVPLVFAGRLEPQPTDDDGGN